MARFYSDVTKKLYDTMAELETAEVEANKVKDARKEAAEKVKAASDAATAAHDAYVKAVEDYNKELRDFCSKYGTYKTTIRSNDVKLLDPFTSFFNFSFREF